MKRLFLLSLIVLTALCASVYTVSPTSYVAFGSIATFAQSTWEQTKNLNDAHIEMDRIRFVGDIMLARNVEYLMDTYGSDYPFSLLGEHPKSAFLIGNFESAIPEEHIPTPPMQFSFSVDKVHAGVLRAYGFAHLGLANNHSYDFGTDGFNNTVEVLEEYDLMTFGDPSRNASSSIRTITIDDVRFALVGLYAVDGIVSNSVQKALMERAEDMGDVQIVFVHWGEEYKLSHNSVQEKLAQSLIDKGADAIIGHHPHVVQDIGFYKERPIFYSLGNFIFDQYFTQDVQEGLMLELTLKEEKLAFELLPISSIGSKSTARLMSLHEKDIFLDGLSIRSDSSVSEMIKRGTIISNY